MTLQPGEPNRLYYGNPDMPWIDASVFRKAKREKDQFQGDLDL